VLGIHIINRLLTKVQLSEIDLSGLDQLLSFDHASNQVVLAEKGQWL
jgi:hypothetical protein